MAGERASNIRTFLGLLIIVVAVISVAAMLVTSSGSSDADKVTFTVDGIEYSGDSSGNAAVLGSDRIDVVIPSAVTYNSVKYNVTSISDNGFLMAKTVRTVTIPDSVTSIGYSSFQICTSLTDINVSSDNGKYSSVNGVLFDKSGETLIIYPAAKEDKAYTIPSSVKYLDYRAFQYTNHLESLTIDSNDLEISGSMFVMLPALKEVIVPENNTKYSSEEGVLFNKERTELILYPAGRTDSTYQIPDSVTAIGGAAFNYNCYLRTAVMPENLKTIGMLAFSNTSLTSVEIPAMVTSVGANAFANCKDLSSVKIDKGVVSIGYNAFSGCRSLTSITIPDTVQQIGTGVFTGCPKLTAIEVSESNANYTSVQGVLMDKNKKTLISYPAGRTDKDYVIPDGTVTIGESSLDSIQNMISLTIPDSVTTIKSGAFNDCKRLETITIGSGLSNITGYSYSDIFAGCDSLRSIDVSSSNTKYSSQDGVLFDNSKNTLIKYPAKRTGTDYTVPSTVTRMNTYAFDECINLKNLVLSDGLTDMPHLENCSSLTSISIPDKVIYLYSFDGCSSLVSIYIGKGVLSITEGAFKECTSLKSITVDAGNTKYCSVDGILFNKDRTELICYPADRDGTSYTIPDTVRSITGYAFTSCDRLETLTISANVSDINYYAFSECTSLKSITVVSGNKSYTSKDGVLFNKSMTDLILYPAGRTDKSYDIPDGVRNVCVNSFSGYNIEKVTVPGSVESCINGFAARSLKEIIVSDDNDIFSSEGGALLSKDKKELYLSLVGQTEFETPDCVEKITGYLIVDEKVTLSSNVRYVETFSIILYGDVCEIVVKNKDTVFGFASILSGSDEVILKITAPEGFILPGNAVASDSNVEIQYNYVSEKNNENSNVLLYVILIIAAIAVIAIIAIVLIRRSRYPKIKSGRSVRPKDLTADVHADVPILDENEMAEMSEKILSTVLFDVAGRLTKDIRISEDNVEELSKTGTFAQTAIGFMYLYGLGGLKQSDADAFRFFKHASMKGQYYVQLAMACLYATGRGVGKDPKEALYWFGLAEERSSGEFRMNEYL